MKKFIHWKAENRFKYGKILYITLTCNMEEIFDSAAINRYDDDIRPNLLSNIQLCFMPDGSFSHFEHERYHYTLESGTVRIYYDEKGGNQIEQRWWNSWK